MVLQSLIGALNTDSFRIMNLLANPVLNVIMYYWAKSYLIVLPLIAIFLLLRKDKKVFTFAIAIVAMYLVSDLIKIAVKEPRPCSVADLSWIHTYGGCESGFSFPSSHASTLTGLAIFVNGYKYLRVAYWVWLFFVLFGRVYLGDHYFTDVIAGMALSVVLAWLINRYRKPVNDFCEKVFDRIIGLFYHKKWFAGGVE